MLILQQIDIITTKNNDSIRKLGNIKSELNQIWANKTFFQSTVHIYRPFSQSLLLTLNKLPSQEATNKQVMTFHRHCAVVVVRPPVGEMLGKENQFVWAQTQHFHKTTQTEWWRFSLWNDSLRCNHSPTAPFRKSCRKTFLKWLHTSLAKTQNSFTCLKSLSSVL